MALSKEESLRLDVAWLRSVANRRYLGMRQSTAGITVGTVATLASLLPSHDTFGALASVTCATLGAWNVVAASKNIIDEETLEILESAERDGRDIKPDALDYLING